MTMYYLKLDNAEDAAAIRRTHERIATGLIPEGGVIGRATLVEAPDDVDACETHRLVDRECDRGTRGCYIRHARRSGLVAKVSEMNNTISQQRRELERQRAAVEACLAVDAGHTLERDEARSERDRFKAELEEERIECDKACVLLRQISDSANRTISEHKQEVARLKRTVRKFERNK